MASGKRAGSSGTAGGGVGRRRRGPTIELTATEVAAASQPQESPQPEPAHAAKPPMQDTTQQASTADEKATAPQAGEPWHDVVRARTAAWIAGGAHRPFVVGGAAGAAGVLLVLIAVWAAGLFSAREGDAVASRLAPIEAQVRELASRPAPVGVDTKLLDDLSARMAKIETAVAAPRTDPALASRMTGAESAVRSMADAVADLSRRIDNTAAAMRDAASRVDAAAAAASAAEQKSERALQGRLERGDIEALANRIAALEKSAKSIGEELSRRAADTASDRVDRFAIAAEALRAAVERGDSYASELAAAKALAVGTKVPEALDPFAATGIPSAAALGEELKALTPAMLRAARLPAREAGVLDKLQASAERLVRIRRIGDGNGDDPETIIARIEIKAANGDLTGSLDELSKLPDAARAPAGGWKRRAEARAAAIAASRRLAAEALAALGKSPQ